MRVVLEMKGTDGLINAVKLLDQEVANRFVPDAVNAATAVVTRKIRDLTPVQRGRALRLPKNARRPRLQQSIIYEYRGYPKAARIKTMHVGIAGAPARLQPHQWLVESGTVQRFTNSRRVRTSRAQIGVINKTRLHRSRDGTVSQRQYQKKVWSNVYESRKKRKNQPQYNRGSMPAFNMFRRGSAEAAASAASELTTRLRAGLASVRFE